MASWNNHIQPGWSGSPSLLQRSSLVTPAILSLAIPPAYAKTGSDNKDKEKTEKSQSQEGKE
jgi:hypothetical protein